MEIKSCFIKKKKVFFGPKGFHRVLLLRYCKNEKKEIFLAVIFYIFDIRIYVLDFIQKNKKNFFTQLYVSTCP